MQAMPDPVKDTFGALLLDAQYGDHPDGARPFGEGLPGAILKLVEDYDGETYRAAYTVELADAVYVLDVFQKKAKQGAKTPQTIKDRVLARYKAVVKAHSAAARRGGPALPGDGSP